MLKRLRQQQLLVTRTFICLLVLSVSMAAASGSLDIWFETGEFSSSCNEGRGGPDVACAMRYRPYGSDWSGWIYTKRVSDSYSPVFDKYVNLAMGNSFNGYIDIDVKCDDTDNFSGNDDMGSKTWYSGGYVAAPSAESTRLVSGNSGCSITAALFKFELSCNSDYVYPYCLPCASCNSATQYESVSCAPPTRNRQCSSCHSQCSGGCHGPGANDCKACRNVKDGATCVQQCPNGKYANVRSECEPCSSCVGDTYVTRTCSPTGNTQCAPCGCNSAGSTGMGCNNATGQCVCKSKVQGRTCADCKAGFGLLSSSEPEGCRPVCMAGCQQGSCAVPYACDCQPGWYGRRCDSACTKADGCTEVRFCENGHPGTSKCSACANGYYLSGDKCRACEPGSWCYHSVKYTCGENTWSAAKASQCEPCWEHSSSAAGSATCTCADTFELVGQGCRTCRENFYCAAGVSKPCEASSHAPPGSATCECNDGYFGDQLNCQRCSGMCDTCDGPGDDKCTSCRTGRFLNPGRTCEDDCPVSHWANVTSNECDACGDQCIGCDGGSTNSDCKACMVLRDHIDSRVTCVVACPHGSYPAADDSCQACHKDCDGCTGPSSFECLGCRHVLSKADGERCAPHCHLGEEYRNGSSVYGEKNVCLPCHSECRGCTGPTDKECARCRNQRYGDRCVFSCPLDLGLYTDGLTCQADRCPAGSAPSAQSMDPLKDIRLYECEPLVSNTRNPTEGRGDDGTGPPVAAIVGSGIGVVVILVALALVVLRRGHRGLSAGRGTRGYGQASAVEASADGIAMTTNTLTSTPSSGPEYDNYVRTGEETVVGGKGSTSVMYDASRMGEPVYGRFVQLCERTDIRDGQYSQQKVRHDYAEYDDVSDAIVRSVDHNNLKMMATLGSGAFGIVRKAVFAPSGRAPVVAAVKILRPEATEKHHEEFAMEAELLCSLRHVNIVRVLGMTSLEPFMLVLEFAEMGSLDQYLLKRRPPEDSYLGPSAHRIPLCVILGYASQLASGLAYLDSMSIVHRDMAARNVLVASVELVKIADFGLSKTLGAEADYYKSRGGKVPIRWLAPETLGFRRFSHASDVWALGMCMFEMLTYGTKPFAQIPKKVQWSFVQRTCPMCCPPWNKAV